MDAQKMELKMIVRFLAVALACALFFLSCSNQQDGVAIRSDQKLPDQILENSVVVFTVNGIKSTVVKAKYIEKYLESDVTKAAGIYADFFDVEGKHVSILVADSGNIKEKIQIMEVRGNVVVTTDEGVKLETTSLRWDPNTSKVVTSDFVKITRDTDVVTGYGLESDPELKKIKIRRNVSGEIKNITRDEIS